MRAPTGFSPKYSPFLMLRMTTSSESSQETCSWTGATMESRVIEDFMQAAALRVYCRTKQTSPNSCPENVRLFPTLEGCSGSLRPWGGRPAASRFSIDLLLPVFTEPTDVSCKCGSCAALPGSGGPSLALVLANGSVS